MEPLLMPAVCKLISSYEKQLSDLLGSRVELRIKVIGETLTPYEANKLKLQKLICEEFNVSWAQVVNGGRKGRIPDAKKAYTYIGLKHLNYKINEIKEDLGGVHHSTIVFQRKKAEGFFEVNDGFKERVENILIHLYNQAA